MSEDLDKLDRLAAEKIMGWSETSAFYTADNKIWPNPEARMEWIGSWKPTRNIAQAWELLEKVGNIHREVFWQDAYKKWRCEVGEFDDAYQSADTAPLAITKACLKAWGISVDSP